MIPKIGMNGIVGFDSKNHWRRLDLNLGLFTSLGWKLVLFVSVRLNLNGVKRHYFLNFAEVVSIQLNLAPN